MEYTFDGAVSVEFPELESRPVMRQTFMLVGIGVTLDTAPTTSEELLLSTVSTENDTELEVVKRDLSSPAVMDWLHLIDDGPLPLPQNRVARLVYPNTDTREINITFIGYWI